MGWWCKRQANGTNIHHTVLIIAESRRGRIVCRPTGDSGSSSQNVHLVDNWHSLLDIRDFPNVEKRKNADLAKMESRDTQPLSSAHAFLERTNERLARLWTWRYRYLTFWLVFIVLWGLLLAPRSASWEVPATLLIQYLYVYIPAVYLHNQLLMPKLFLKRNASGYLLALSGLVVATLLVKAGLDWASREVVAALWGPELSRLYYGETLWVQMQRVGAEIESLLVVLAVAGCFKVMKHLHQHSADRSEADPPTDLFFKVDRRMVRVPLASLWYVEGLKDYVVLQTEAEKLVVKKTMKYMAAHLPAEHFMRIHRSYIINLQAIRTVTSTNVEVPDRLLPIGETYREAFLNHLDQYMVS